MSAKNPSEECKQEDHRYGFVVFIDPIRIWPKRLCDTNPIDGNDGSSLCLLAIQSDYSPFSHSD